MSLRGHLCYRDHLSFSIFLSINPGLEADGLFRWLMFNASCLVTVLIRGCCPEKKRAVSLPLAGTGIHWDQPAAGPIPPSVPREFALVTMPVCSLIARESV